MKDKIKIDKKFLTEEKRYKTLQGALNLLDIGIRFTIGENENGIVITAKKKQLMEG